MCTHALSRKSKAEMLAQLAREGLAPKSARLAARNTLDYTLANGERRVRLHCTDILTIKPSGALSITTGGFNTRTTRDRLNTFLPHGQVYTTKGTIHYRQNGKHWPFLERITIGPRGAVRPDYQPESIAKLHKQLDAFMAHVRKTGLPSEAQSIGDPWTPTPDSVTRETALDWLREKYWTRRLCALALEYAGMQPLGVHYTLVSLDKHGLDKTTLRRVRRFMRAKIGLES